MPPKRHAVLGASSSERWMACPGSVRMSEGQPDDVSIYAIEGTAAHELAEYCLREGQDAADKVGDVYTIPERMPDGTTQLHQIEVTEEMAEAVQVFLDHVRSRWDDADVWLELAMSLKSLDPPEDMFGTGDVVIWHQGAPPPINEPSLLEIIDYKHGRGVVVDAIENSQLRYYALAAVVTLGLRPERIRMTIVQPRAPHPDGPIRSEEIDAAELVAFKRELFAAAEATQAPDAPLVVGDHCKFCRGLATCPAQKQHATEVTLAAFPEVEPPAPETLTPGDLAVVLAAKDGLSAWLAAVEAHARGLLERGEDVPGFKLVEGRKGHRKWADEEAADKWLARRKLKVAERYKRSLVSPAQAEKLMKQAGTQLPDDLVTQADGKRKIAPAGDSRPALPPAASVDAFGVVPGDDMDSR